jgi:thymidylate kinase
VLVALEGIDGSGKTTTVPRIADRLRARGFSATEAEKRKSIVSDDFARAQLDAVGARLWSVPHDARLAALGTLHWVYLNAAYFAGTHFALTAELGPRDIVIFDNWVNKFIARIAANGELPLEHALNEFMSLPQPDFVILLDVDPSVAASRRQFSELERGALRGRRLDFESYQSEVRQNLLLMARHFDWAIVTPGDRTPDEVADELADLIEARAGDGDRTDTPGPIAQRTPGPL